MREMRTQIIRFVAVKPDHDWAKKFIGSVQLNSRNMLRNSLS